MQLFTQMCIKEIITLRNKKLVAYITLYSCFNQNASENVVCTAEVVCCKKLSSITDEISIEANSVYPEQTAPLGAV